MAQHYTPQTILDESTAEAALRMEVEELFKEYGEAAVTIMASDMYFELHPDEDEDTPDENSADPEAPAADAAAVPAAATTTTGTASQAGAATSSVVATTPASTKTYTAAPVSTQFWALYTARKHGAPYRTAFATDTEAKTFLADGLDSGKIKSALCIITPTHMVIVHKAGADAPYKAGKRLYDSLMARHTIATTIPVDLPKTKYVPPVKTATTTAPKTGVSVAKGGSSVSTPPVKSASDSAAVFISTSPAVLQ